MLTIPNILSILRICLTFIFLVLFYLNYIKTSIIILSLSVLTDFLDGMLARVLKQETVLGSFLDPLADKLLVDITFIIFIIRGYVPWWLFLCVIIRDTVTVIGWLILKVRTTKFSLKTYTRVLGKTTIFFQMVTIVTVMLSVSIDIEIFSIITPVFWYITAGLSVISLIDNILYAKEIV